MTLEIRDELCDFKGRFKGFLYDQIVLKVWSPGTHMCQQNELLYVKHWVTYKLKNTWKLSTNEYSEFPILSIKELLLHACYSKNLVHLLSHKVLLVEKVM